MVGGGEARSESAQRGEAADGRTNHLISSILMAGQQPAQSEREWERQRQREGEGEREETERGRE